MGGGGICPVVAAKALSEAGRFLIGWTSARVQILEARPMRCFKCMGLGHTRQLCPSSADRSGLCFRCGNPGHKAAECSAKDARCAVCAEAGRDASHHMGGRNCNPPQTRGKTAAGVLVPLNPTGFPLNPTGQEIPGVTWPSSAAQDPLPNPSYRGSVAPDSVTAEEVAAAVAKLGDCSVDNVKVGTPRLDHTGLLAVYVRCPTAAAKSVLEGRLLVGWVAARGCVAALVGDIVIVGCYFSPNRSVAEFETFLAEAGTLLTGWGRPHEVLVAGDLNSKSQSWGSRVTDIRGELVEDWLVSHGLVVVNRGTVDTCVRMQGGSVVDITFASPALARRVQTWEVMEGVETLSDHRYVRFDISPPFQVPPSSTNRAPEEIGPRWALKRLDRDTLAIAALVESWSPWSDGAEPGREVEWFREAMSHVCDAAMPRVRVLPPRTAVHWWSPELARLREAFVAARRCYSRHRRRRNRDESQDSPLYAVYQEAKKALRGAIGAAKNAAWEELLSTLNQDPWGRPYRLVMSKLRPWTPPLTTTMDPGLLSNVVEALFPAREEWVPPVCFSSEGVSGDEAPEVTEGELGAAILRLRVTAAIAATRQGSPT
ncbi:uncharacterized protein LOC135087403 [Ostrinia nubilalis]|uniref:uncharacterized protein LOC135087403 n=1 Tax=Ostrinia nubilalis TaxID=29057 RepID=UPI0030823B57